MKSDHIEKRGKDHIPLASAVRAYIRFLKEDERRSSNTASASRLQDERTREVALRNAERDGSSSRQMNATAHAGGARGHFTVGESEALTPASNLSRFPLLPKRH